MKARVPMTKEEWLDLEEKLRFRAFTVAALSDVDAVERIKNLTSQSIERGVPLQDFWTTAKTESASGLGDSPWYWETVYRTNIQTSYNAGRAVQFTKAQPEYLEFVGIEDSRQTDICNERSGTILPATHPFWQNNWPPLHFNCRSTVRAVFQEEVDALKEENPNWDISSENDLPQANLKNGFGFNPIQTESFYKLTPQMLERAEKYGINDSIKKFGEKLNLKYDSLVVSNIANKNGVLSYKKDLPGDSIARNEERKKTKELLLAHRDQSFDNTTLKEKIKLDKTGIDHAIAFSGDNNKLAILEHLNEIISNATDFVSFKEKNENPNFIEVLKGKSVIEINGKRNLFGIILKRDKKGILTFYELIPWKVK